MQDIKVKAEWDGFAGLIERLDQMHGGDGDTGGRANPGSMEAPATSPVKSLHQNELAPQNVALKKTLCALESELRAYAWRKPKTAPLARPLEDAHARRRAPNETAPGHAVDLEFVKLALEFIKLAQVKEPGLKEEIDLLRGELGEVASRLSQLCSAAASPAPWEANGGHLLDKVESISDRIDDLASAKSVNSLAQRLSSFETQLGQVAITISQLPSPLRAGIARDLASALEELKSGFDAKLAAPPAAAKDLNELKSVLLEKLTKFQAGQDARHARLDERTERLPKEIIGEIREELEKTAKKFGVPEKIETKFHELMQNLSDAGRQAGRRDLETQIPREMEQAISRLISWQESENQYLRQSLGSIEAEIQNVARKMTQIETGLDRPTAVLADALAQTRPLASSLEPMKTDAFADVFGGASLGLIEPGRGYPIDLLAIPETGKTIEERAGKSERLPRLADTKLSLAEGDEVLSRQDFIAAARRASQAVPSSAPPFVLSRAHDEGATEQENLGSPLIQRLKRLVKRIKKPSALTLLALLILGAAYNHLEDGDLAKGQGHAQADPAPAQPLDASYATSGAADSPQIAAAGAKPPTSTLAAEVFGQAIHGPSLAGGTPPSALFSNQPMAGADKIPAAALQPAAQPLALSVHEDTTNAAGLSREFLNLKAQAEAGNPAAQYAIALRYASGEGVARDYKQALEFFGKAANQGLAPAQFRLASIYEKGLGTEPNAKIAALWYQRAAQTGNVHAMHNLGVLLAEGLDGRPDYAKAAFWFAQAAAYGEGDSQFNLAVLLGRGLGVTQDLTKSYAWFAIAAALGDAEAGKRRDETGARLSMGEIQTAQKFVQAYLSRPRDPIANNVDSPPPGFASKIPVVAKNSDL